MTDALVIRPDLFSPDLCDRITQAFLLKVATQNPRRVAQDSNVTFPLKSLFQEHDENYGFFRQWVPTLPYFLEGMQGWEGLRPDYTAVTMLQNGGGHVPHADNSKPDGSPNHCRWREKTCLLYLNDGGGREFSGGILHFPKIGVAVDPRKGLFVGFPCDLEYTHEVWPVTAGRRFALAVWFTHDEKHWERW